MTEGKEACKEKQFIEEGKAENGKEKSDQRKGKLSGKMGLNI